MKIAHVVGAVLGAAAVAISLGIVWLLTEWLPGLGR